MQKIFINSAIGILCFVLGYVAYPIINNTETVMTVSNNNNVNTSNKAAISIEKPRETMSTINPHLTAAANNQQTAELTELTAIVDADVDDISHGRAIFNNGVTAEEVLGFEQALEDWSTEHKNHLNDLIDAYMSNQRSAEGMKSQIAKDNDFLQKPKIKQDPVEDANWAYTMEQQVRMLIAQHELSASFNVINVSCKQLVCDILGAEKTANTWFNLYISLLQSLPNADFADDNGAKSVVYLENNNTMVYFQIKFKHG
ncbi:MAG: hypothetical protein NWQ54_25780 [Paraglaciecola sp.]|uniref:Uncharacterized protein n=1 Tax=Alishewanella maricola TaxID=2795740 RepID=A0ABS8C705_9ALTE|nr:hypothetical protein [Alishewanella maricola]MCB5228067.1 hypothetical protein [Alishewanella maricola]MDP4944637.1 hypothetical protein [Alishewanella sp.]MDP5134308.1 hypothetical protein [Paraglaciecola sp.]